MGQRSRIVTQPGETGGRGFVLEYINRPWSGEHAVPSHVHSAYTETFEILIQGLATAGRVNAKVLPNLLQLAVLIETTMPATYLDGLPIPLQRLLFGTLGSFGRLTGYKTAYPEYGVITPQGLDAPARA